MILWILALLMTLFVASIVAFALAFPRLVYGFGKPPSREEAVSNGSELVKNTRCVVAVAAHPDDLECDTGGTLAKLNKKGAKVIAVICADKSDKQDIRRKEELVAAKALGYEKVIFLGLQDGELSAVSKDEVAAKLADIYEKYNADTVFAFDPVHENWLYKHPDHKASAEAAIEAANTAEIPHLYLYFGGASDTYVDISDTIEQKLDGWASFESQQTFFPSFAGRYYFTSAAKWEGSKVELKYAEPFRKVR